MTFQLVYLSQQDPQWKNDRLGLSTDPDDTIGKYGCALTSISMLVSGHGYTESPKTLNEKLKAKGGFSGSAIFWGAVSQAHPEITLKEDIRCENTDAPLAKINAAIDAGQPVVVRVDSSPAPGLQWHYVMLYGRKGNDYLMLDPWPYKPGTDKEDLMMARYSQGRPLERAIQQVLIYNCSTTGSGGAVSTPSGASTTSATSSASLGSGPRARVKADVSLGLNIRSSTDTSSLANLVVNVPAGTELALIEADGPSKIGVNGQWVRVRTAEGQEGLTAAWFLENVSAASSTSQAESTSSPVNEAPTGTSTTTSTTGSTSTVGRSRPSMGDGLENVPLEAPADKRINDTKLLARIWNKYGGLLIAIAAKMEFDPAIAVAIIAQESGGYAFGADGRMIIRFENHLFYEYWGKKNASTYNNHFQSGTPIWTGHKWRPKPSAQWKEFHGNQSAEWDVFTFARQLDDTAAIKSISMGLPQTLGSNYTVLGFASVQDMFNAFASERNQVIAFFDFLQGNGATATNALKNRDFRTIAAVYNGAGNADAYGKAINEHYNAFLALQGTTASTNTTTSTPTTQTTTSTTTTSTTSSTASTPVNPTTPSTGSAVVRVKAEVTAGLNIRTSTDTSSMANVVFTAPAGSQLTLLSSNDLSKIGVNGQWVRVRTEQGNEGYTAAWFLEKVVGATPPAGTTSASNPSGGSTTSATSTPPATSTTTSTSTPPPSEPVEREKPPKPQVIVDNSVGARGLSLRQTASTSGALVTVLKAGTKLTVLEPVEKATPKVGKPNMWILVKEPEGRRGYVSAQFVKFA